MCATGRMSEIKHESAVLTSKRTVIHDWRVKSKAFVELPIYSNEPWPLKRQVPRRVPGGEMRTEWKNRTPKKKKRCELRGGMHGTRKRENRERTRS